MRTLGMPVQLTGWICQCLPSHTSSKLDPGTKGTSPAGQGLQAKFSTYCFFQAYSVD